MLYITDFMLEGHYRWNGGLLLEGRTTVGTEDYCWNGGLLLEGSSFVFLLSIVLKKGWCTLEYVTVVSHVITITERH